MTPPFVLPTTPSTAVPTPATASPFAAFQPPTSGDEPDADAQADFAGALDDNELNDVEKLGDLVPAGTYHVRFVKCEKRTGKTDAGSFGPQPMYALQMAIQEEPFVGRRVFDNIFWVTPSIVKAMNDSSNPYSGEAKKIYANRLGRWKALKQDAFGLTGKVHPDEILLDVTRECKVVIAHRNRRALNAATGQWEATSEKEVVVSKYLPLRG